MIQILQDRFSMYSNFELINDDVLKVDLKSLIKENKKDKIKAVKIVANLPYYITTPIIMKLLEERLEIESITVMVQKEVADRLVAKPGGKNSGAITYAISYFADAKKVLEVPNTSFMPIRLTGTGAFSARHSHTAPPRPPITECSSTVTTLPVFFAY